jgi:hypothetical protein
MIWEIGVIYLTGIFLLLITLTVRVFDKNFKDQKEMRAFLKAIPLWPFALAKIIHSYFKSLPSGE